MAGDPLQHIRQIRFGIEAVQLRRLDQAVE